jgi:hypothetical protein
MSDESPDAAADDGIAGVYAFSSDMPGGTSTENLVLAMDGTFSYEQTDQGESHPVREPDGSYGFGPPAAQTTTASGS